MVSIFENELEKGTGIPYLFIKNGVIQPSEKIDTILLDNILNCNAYDPQVEGIRHEYLYSIVSNYPNKDFIYSEVLKSFNTMSGTDWGEQQVFGFVCELAKENRIDKKIVYEKIKFYIENGNDDQYPMYYFAEKEGVCASEFIARELGKYFEKNPDYVFCEYDGFFQSFNNKDEVIGYLKKSEDRYVKIYMENIKEKEPVSSFKKKTAEEIIKKYFDEGDMFYPLGRWLKKSNESERTVIARYAMDCKNEKLKYSILGCFEYAKIPLDYDLLKFDYLKQENLEYKIDLLKAMLLLEKPEVKELIYDLDFKNLDVIELYIKSLCIFYDEEDDGILLEKIENLDTNTCHGLLSFLLENKNLKSNLELYKKIVFRLYYKNRCSFCREKVFDAMVEFDFLDRDICEEFMHDCNKDMAKKAREYFITKIHS